MLTIVSKIKEKSSIYLKYYKKHSNNKKKKPDIKDFAERGNLMYLIKNP